MTTPDLSWLEMEKYFDAVDRATVEGFADTLLVAINTADLIGLKKVNLGTLPPWAQDKMREWFGPPQLAAMPKAA